MGKNCSVEGCANTSTTSNVPKFKPPKNRARRKLWSESLGFELGNASYVCVAHFRPEDIKAEDTVGDGRGNIIYRHEYTRKQLSRTAIPLPLVNGQRPRENPEYAFNNGIQVIKVETIKVEEEDALPHCTDEAVASCSQDDPLNLEEDDDSPENVMKDSQESHNLYNEIVFNRDKIELPGEDWAIHQCTKSGTFVFSTLTANLESVGCIIPVYTKQVIVSNSKVQLRVLHKNVGIAQAKPKSVEELEEFLKKIDSYGICRGAQKAKDEVAVDPRYIEVSLDQVIRHKQCVVMLLQDGVCQHCAKL